MVAAGISLLLLSAVLVAALNGLHAFAAMAFHNVMVVLMSLLLVVVLVPRLGTGARGQRWPLSGRGSGGGVCSGRT